MIRARRFTSILLSTAVHAAGLISLWFVQLQLRESFGDTQAFETVVGDDETAVRDDVTQQIEPVTAVSQTLSAIGVGVASEVSFTGGPVGDGGGGGGTGAGAGGQKSGSRVQIEAAGGGTGDVAIRFTAGDVAVPGAAILAADLEKEVLGETAAPVEGYEAALSRITQELIRLMRQKPVLVVWMFDESESMQDDQKEIRAHFHKVYEELGILAERERTSADKSSDVLQTIITSFGETRHQHTPRPTSDVNAIRAAIDKIPVDESGLENMCAAIETAIDDYRSFTQGGKRRMILIVVSDESGDDGDRVEAAIQKARRANVPVYVLGREAIFGYPYARLRWKDPIFGLDHWLQITRGPETAGPECLQWDGLHSRWDSYSSGFGPFEQVRIAKETGGIFFVLPGEEESLSGAGARENRKFEFLDMKQYEPNLIPRQEYEQARNASPFRSQIWNVILTLNPYQDEMLNIRELYYPAEPDRFRSEAKTEFDKAVRGMQLADQASVILEKLAPLRAKEDSPRWRAAYDLLYAQCLAYRVRLFQFILALDQHAKSPPQFTNEKSNVWNVVRTPEILPPDKQQVELTRVDLKKLNQQEHRARELFERVVDEHPRTPWARRAQTELRWGFGMRFSEHFHDPRYYELERRKIKFPKF